MTMASGQEEVEEGYYVDVHEGCGIGGTVSSRTPSICLVQRFKAFLASREGAENIDVLPLPEGATDSKKADYFLGDRRVTIELKSLEADPEYKAGEVVEKHRDEEGFPIVYGTVPSHTIIEAFPNGKEVEAEIFQKIMRSVEEAFRSADRQILATKNIFAAPESAGLLIILNQDIGILSPQAIAAKVSEMLLKKNGDDSLRYPNVAAVLLISESHSISSTHGAELLPCLTISGPTYDKFLLLDVFLHQLQKEWAAANGIPFINAGNCSDTIEKFTRRAV